VDPRGCLGALALAGLIAGGCDVGGAIEIPTPPDGGAGGGGGAGPGAGGGAGAPDSGGGGADAGVAPVLVGITPTPAMPTAAGELQAELTAFAAGARAAVITVRWDAEPAATGEALAKKAAFYAQQDKAVLLRLLIVDRVVDRRPAPIAGSAWQAEATIDAMKEQIDLLFASTGDEVRYLTFGRDVDVYLDAHPDERPGIVAFTKEAAAYAKGHADAPEGIAIGVSLTADAPKMEIAFQDIVEPQDVIAFSYLPGLGTYEPEASSGVAATVTQLADIAGTKPIVLEAAGLASDPAAGGSEDAQQKFFATLFGAVTARRESFALVNVVELHDAPDAACDAWAMEQGAGAGEPLAAYVCSLGLFGDGGVPRPAWSAVLAGSAALSTP
jgi:hypothetical protein